MERVDPYSCAKLVTAVITDAIGNVRTGNSNAKSSWRFLAGTTGSLLFWLDMVPGIDADAYVDHLREFCRKNKVADEERRGFPGRSRLILKYRDGTETTPAEVVERYGVNYTTLVNRHGRRPSLPVEDLVLKKLPPVHGGREDIVIRRASGNTVAIGEGADLLGMTYATLYSRWRLHPGKTLEELGCVGKKLFEVCDGQKF